MCSADAPDLAAKATLTGNPVRPAVVAAAATPYPAPARSVAAPGFRRQPGRAHHGRYRARRDRAARTGLRARLAIVQQAREEDLTRVREAYAKLAVAAEIAPFFADLPARMAASHLVVSRSGARPSPNSPRSAGRRSWCRCRTRSIRTNSPMPACSKGPAAPSGWRRTRSPRSGSPPRSRRSPPRRSGSPPWRRRPARVGRLDAADRLADLVLKVAASGRKPVSLRRLYLRAWDAT